MPTVSIESQNLSYEVEKMQTILSALRELPSSCQRGTCGTCRVIVTQGMENLSPPSTLEQETIESLLVNYRRLKGDDYLTNEKLRLACLARVLGNIEIKLLD